MAANPSIQLGTDGNWAIKEDNLLAYKKDGTRFFNKEFDFTRNTTATFLDQNGLIQESATNTPRIDFTDDATGHLLLEPQSTNLLTYSEQFDNAAWNANSDVLLESGYAAPDGSNNAYKVTKNGGNSKVALFITNPSTSTKSIYARTVNGTGTIYLGEGNFTGTLFNVTEQWQRFEFTNSQDNFYAADFRGPATLTEVIIWGAQMEELSYATSYIPTYGSTATRNAEVCNNSGSVQDFNDSEGVLYTEIASLVETDASRSISISNASNWTKRLQIVLYSTGDIYAYINNGVIARVLSTSVDYGINMNKIALRYTTTSVDLYINGVLAHSHSSDYSFTSNTLNVLDFKIRSTNGENFYGKTKNLKVFKRALSDGELYLLTVPQYQSYQEMATALNYTL
jgi:hypothetical protein